ncbi:MAG: sigma-70 family RNA polymerase sigma factor [Pseudarcicella sp.]|nr:sigma-70 family RNA polymerase sigma factor [Pseudarcicella sp.]MBP6410091.1 sigma-70 family RNA polymerase sigma factor [Pseudarcicella sp.]
MLFFKEKSDESIIDNIKKGGVDRKRAENSLYQKYQYFIKDASFKHQISKEDCFSLYSESIISLIENIDTGRFEQRSSIKTYLYRIFFNKCVSQIRKNATNTIKIRENDSPITYKHLDELPDDAKGIVSKLIAEDDSLLLTKMLSKLGDKCQELLSQWSVGKTDKEIAGNMGYNNEFVAKTSRIRCLDKLREFYLGNNIKK